MKKNSKIIKFLIIVLDIIFKTAMANSITVGFKFMQRFNAELVYQNSSNK